MINAKKQNDLILTVEQSVEITAHLTHILVDLFSLDGYLETETDEHGNECYTDSAQDIFDHYSDRASEIICELGFTISKHGEEA